MFDQLLITKRVSRVSSYFVPWSSSLWLTCLELSWTVGSCSWHLISCVLVPSSLVSLLRRSRDCMWVPAAPKDVSRADRYRCRWPFWCHRPAMRCSVKALTVKGRPNFNGWRSRSTAQVLDSCRRPLCLWLEGLFCVFPQVFRAMKLLWSWSTHSKRLIYTSIPSRRPGARGRAVVSL